MLELGARAAVLGRRNFRLLFFGRTISLLGDGLAPIAIAFGVLELTGSATDLGLVMAARSIVIVALVLAGGVFADRISPRLAMVRADLIRLVAMGLMGALLLAGVAEIWELAVLYAIEGMATALFNPASNALIPGVVPAEDLQDANALLNLSRSAGKVAGPALGGLLLLLGPPGVAIVVDGVTFGVSAVFIFAIRAPRARIVTESFAAELREGWAQFSSRTWLWVCVLGAAVSNAIFFPAFQVLGPTVAHDSLGGSSAWAVVATAFGLGALAGGAVALTIRPRRALFVGEALLILAAVPLASLALGVSWLLVAGAAFLGGVALSLAEILYETATQQHVPTEVMARVSSYDWFGSLAIQPLGFIVIGPLAAGIGIPPVLWVGVAGLILCQVAVLLVPSVRRLEASPASQALAPPALAPVSPGD